MRKTILLAVLLTLIMAACSADSGSQGAAGPQSAQGVTGPQGLQGASGQQGAQGAPGPQGPPGPQGLPGNSDDVWPELNLDFTLSKTCADSLKATIEYRGTAEEIEKSRKGVEFLLGLPARYMTDDQIYNIGNLINNIESGQWRCTRDVEALALFQNIRENNPMGAWREDVLKMYWRCEYPGDQWLADGYESNEGECESLRQWLPETWVPQKSI